MTDIKKKIKEILEEIQKITDCCIMIHKGKIIKELNFSQVDNEDISELFYEIVSKE